MSISLEQRVQDANVLASVFEKYAPEMAEVGETAENLQELHSVNDTVVLKNTAHQDAMRRVVELTKTQNLRLEAAGQLIVKFQKAAKSVFTDKQILREFRVGENAPESVSEMVIVLALIKNVAGQRLSDLAVVGLKESDLAEFDTCSAALTAADNVQENAKRVQLTISSEKDAALKQLTGIVSRIRKRAAFRFASDKNILAEFRSIIPPKKTKTAATETTTTTTGS